MATSESQAPLRVGYVPEHFSTPLHFALLNDFFARHSLPPPTLTPFPSGTGHMVKSLESSPPSIDIAIGLTDGWIAALANGSTAYHLVGEYVETPLRWAISTGAKRDELQTAADLQKNKNLGVSRIGSGSYVMGWVLADQEGWGADNAEGKSHFEFVVCDTFKRLREAVNEGRADAFMWEYFTTKRYYDSGEIRQIGYIDTPWPSWHIVASSTLTSSQEGRDKVKAFLETLNEGVKHFQEHLDDAVKYISTNLDYSEEDAREWLKTVKFAPDVKKVRPEVVEKTVQILKKAGVVKEESKVGFEDMVVKMD